MTYRNRKVIKQKRKCVICSSPLSRYNRTNKCFHHTETEEDIDEFQDWFPRHGSSGPSGNDVIRTQMQYDGFYD